MTEKKQLDTNQLPPGYVLIHDRLYKTVAKRVQEFREEHTLAGGWGIVTTILEATDEIVRMRAEVVAHGVGVIGVGHAEETRTGNINATSAVENCETSAIGRALASCGYGGSDLEYASAEEMIRAEKQQHIMEEGKLSPVKMRRYADGMNKAVQDEDGPGLLQLADELTNEQQGWLWQQFRSYERTAIKKLLSEARDNANQPDPNLQDSSRNGS